MARITHYSAVRVPTCALFVRIYGGDKAPFLLELHEICERGENTLER